MDEYLWPARNVAEYAYCPRLFYLMEIEGIHIANADTEAGVATHKRVDRPSAATAEDDPDRPRVLRSLTLTSKTLGLTATLDLAEISGNAAVPVEYRKGRPKFATLAPPPDDPGEAEEQPLGLAWRGSLFRPRSGAMPRCQSMTFDGRDLALTLL